MSLMDRQVILDTSMDIRELVDTVLSKINIPYIDPESKTTTSSTGAIQYSYYSVTFKDKYIDLGAYYFDDYYRLDELIELMAVKKNSGKWVFFTINFFNIQVGDDYFLATRFVNALLELAPGDCIFTNDDYCITKLLRRDGELLVDEYLLSFEEEAAEIILPYKVENLPRLTR